ncbi:MAG: hypothetical protein NVSMB9_01260 [Isosphaeraceae bacterium]
MLLRGAQAREQERAICDVVPRTHHWDGLETEMEETKLSDLQVQQRPLRDPEQRS